MNGEVMVKRTARVAHRCDECKLSINPGEPYCEVTVGGGGLASIKHPERYHEYCYDLFHKGSKESQVKLL